MSWRDRALCAEVGGEFWFPEKGGSTKAAKRICAACPVARQCLEEALSMDTNPEGIWGGTSVEQRRVMRKTVA